MGVPDVWSAAEYPGRALEDDEWSALFEHAGFTVNGVRAERPTEPLVLFRAAPEEHRLGWSWTDDSRVPDPV